MADESPLGTPALRSTLSLVQAQTAAAPRGNPAPPPDGTTPPWERRPAMADEIQENMRRLAAQGKDPATALIPPAQVTQRRVEKSAKRTPSAGVYQVVDALLNRWSKHARKNLEKANMDLAEGLAQCGSKLIESYAPMDTISGLIKLCNELAKNSAGDSGNDDRLEALITQFTKPTPPRDVQDTQPEEPEDAE